LAYGLLWIGARLGSIRALHLETKIYPILDETIEIVTPVLYFHHEKMVAIMFFSFSII